jgi:hypothetical protein
VRGLFAFWSLSGLFGKLLVSSRRLQMNFSL